MAQQDRQPLKDTSRHFINTPSTTKVLSAHDIITQQQQSNLKQPLFKKPDLINNLKNNNNEPVSTNNPNLDENQCFFQSHIQKLGSSDHNQPTVISTSTPKKDGYIPYLTNTIKNESTVNLNTKSITENTTTTVNTNLNNKRTTIVTKKMTGNELSKWQKTWKDILPRSFVYFDCKFLDREKKEVMYALKNLGATIEPFFDEHITIIISDRNFDKNLQYPKGDIFKHAIKKQMKVWSVGKVYRFLNHLGEDILTLEEYENNIPTNNQLNNTNNNNLSNLLMNERMFGPSDRDPSVKRSDFKYFSNYYLYIWDITQKTRPVAIREWKDKSYPKIYHTTNGKSLFLPEARSQSTINFLKRHQRRINCLNETFDFRQKIIEASYGKLPLINKSIRHPTYHERVNFKNSWEGISNIHEQMDKLYQSYLLLSPKDKKQFHDIFEKDDLKHKKDINNYDDDSDNNDQSLSSASFSSLNVISTVDISNKRQKINEDGYPSKNIDYNDINKKNCNKESNINNVIENVDDRERDQEELKGKNLQIDEEYDDLNDLISDKSDVIDKINQSIKRELLKNDTLQNKIPKLMRQDSIFNNNSQSGLIDGKLREYGEITASGIQASGVNPSGTHSHGNAIINNIGNGLAPSKSQIVNKTLANESKRVIVLTPTLNTNTTTTLNNNKQNQKNNKNVITANILDDYKESSSKNTINEDDLAALRSVEAVANPFISEGYFKNMNKDNNDFPKSLKCIPKEKINNTTKSQNNEVTYGVFKDQKQEKVKQELKPGYCENCRVKYSDFSDHIETDKHRLFAENDENFKQIDELIKTIKNSAY
jgi:hypothetical protein